MAKEIKKGTRRNARPYWRWIILRIFCVAIFAILLIVFSNWVGLKMPKSPQFQVTFHGELWWYWVCGVVVAVGVGGLAAKCFTDALRSYVGITWDELMEDYDEAGIRRVPPEVMF